MSLGGGGCRAAAAAVVESEATVLQHGFSPFLSPLSITVWLLPPLAPASPMDASSRRSAAT